jgi:protein TonB
MKAALFGFVMAMVLSAGVFGEGQETVYEPGSGVTLPKVVKEVRAQYPTTDTRVQGTVTMKCVVQRDGKVGDVTVVQSLDPRLDDAAVAALKQWEFEPGTRNGMPVAVRVSVEMTFTLK